MPLTLYFVNQNEPVNQLPEDKKNKLSVNVLDVPLYNRDISEACAHVINIVKSDARRENRLVSATGAHGLVYARKNTGFKKILKDFYINLPDGMPGVWIGKLKGARQMRRCYGPDFFKNMMQKSANENVKHFFCGGNEGIADALAKAVEKKFNNKNVAGTFCPPFLPVEKYDYRAIANLIEASGADIVWIGLSTPKQECFANNLAAFTSVHFIMTVGAAFDFHTDKVRQAPSLLQKMGLEWLFRLVMEPKRLYRRYIEIVPLFIYYNIKEMFTFASRKS